MGFFSRKRKVTTDQFCREFYDQHIFPPKIGDADPMELFCKTAYEMVEAVDRDLSSVSIAEFTWELRALRLEIVGLVWSHKIKSKFAPMQSVYTRCYLENRSWSDLWEAMGAYNQAIARSTVSGRDGNTRMGRGYITFLNKMRAGIFDEWVGMGYNAVAAARAANRVGSEESWKSKVVHTYLSFELTDRLQCDVNDEGRVTIMSLVNGFYQGVRQELAGAKIVE